MSVEDLTLQKGKSWLKGKQDPNRGNEGKDPKHGNKSKRENKKNGHKD